MRDVNLEIYGSYLTFKNLSYYVKTPKKSSQEKVEDKTTKKKKGQKPRKADSELQLLREVSGFAKPAELLALMGPSGAGKSTLLDVLADRKSSGRITGEIFINGKERDKYFTRYSAYVTQSDVLFPTSTVREAVTFSAMCRLPTETPYPKKVQFAEHILEGLKLTDIGNKIIGSGRSGLSLEQRKRVNIAVELAANPQMLFLDEPTSGLDSLGARKVMKFIKKLSREGRTIICTVHQPSPEIFKMFDSLLLLSSSGEMVYFGPIGEDGRVVLEYLFEPFNKHYCALFL